MMVFASQVADRQPRPRPREPETSCNHARLNWVGRTTMESPVHTHLIHILVRRGQQEFGLEFKTDKATGLEIKAKVSGSAKDGLYLLTKGGEVGVKDDEV